ncbi:hypothetical protein GYMLUDRAFT_47114 [Collybiopsis luxurians FD-317 M1]|uniref:Tyrosine specific protein phosphatases domain-containing protein n=1 Tax=Collybiopsis luxurians FD-317 M1 TaxID=944289 RepID=A0A0D0B005_9AGAR|nr:hypothetical protein GYMLUDRAFT_47114 [Collybiopsis luxurians FD-317 M1]
MPSEFNLSLSDTALGLVLTGNGVKKLVSNALSAVPAYVQLQEPLYIALLTESEVARVPKDKIDSVTLNPDTTRIYCAGAGKSQIKEVYFAAIIWAEGQKLRKSLGLPSKQFYVTLSATDDPDVDRSIHSLLPGQFPNQPSSEFLDHLVFTLHLLSDYATAEFYCVDLILSKPESFPGFLRLADSAFALFQYKLAMLSYARAFELALDEKVQNYCLKRIEKCSHYSEWGQVFQESELKQVPARLSALLTQPWSENLKSTIQSLTLVPTLCLESRTRLSIPIGTITALKFQTLPRFFRWIIPFHLAAMSTPKSEDDIAALSSMDFRTVLTLTEEEPLPPNWFTRKTISNIFLPIPNYHPPSIEQMDIIMRLVEDETKLPMLVHCGGGKGRAGTVIACYLAAYGFSKPRFGQDHPELSANDAVSALRSLRPGSLETPQQEQFVSKWCSTIWKRQSIYPDRPSEPPPCDLIIDGTLEADANLFVLVGLPGSGKSWFSKSLITRNRKSWTYISQDETGSRASCETEIGYKRSGRVLLDRCNTADKDRRRWLDLASNWALSPVCVWFDYERDICLSRAQMRVGHPTLPPGNRVRNAVDQMNNIFVRPSLKEGFKAIIIIRSFKAARDLISRLSPPIVIYKFPRTGHLLDLGAATSDDIILPPSSALSMSFSGHVIVTEKVDGANMGFSLSSDRSRIVVQNRSHYVNSSSHEQFKKLDLWVEHHREELFQLLNRDEYFAERYILFGEWLYATHSIPYTRLPNRFMAYDLYDRSTDTFVDRQTLQVLLDRTTIPLVPIMYEGHTIPSEEKLKNMVQQPSKFYDGRVEGVYVKWESGGKVLRRGKVVRSDFIAGNEHWSRKNLQVNGLVGVSD